MKQLFTALICIGFLAGNAQKTEGKELFLKLYSGEKVVGTNLTYEMPILKQALFQLDERPFETASVQFFQNKHGYFANLNKVHGDKAERYALRIKQGRVNIYEEVSMDVYGKEELNVSGGSEDDLKRIESVAEEGITPPLMVAKVQPVPDGV